MSISHGNRNLLLLGVGALILAGVSTSVSLAMYRISGDIYLDRSRPGFLPDPTEIEEDDVTTNFTFAETGELTKEDLDEYLRELSIVNNRLKAFSDPYAPDPLSDESLGITGEPEEGGISEE